MSSTNTYEYYINSSTTVESWEDYVEEDVEDDVEEDVEEEDVEEEEEDVKEEKTVLKSKKNTQINQTRLCVDELRDTVKEQKEILEVQTKLNWLTPKTEINGVDNSSSVEYDHQGFPLLGQHQKVTSVNTVVKKKYEPKKGNTTQNLGFGSKSWLDERNEERRNSPKPSSYNDKFKDKKPWQTSRDSRPSFNKETGENRSAAFELLANKESLDDKLNKTQMCNSVGKSKCHHKNCRFAHSLEELKFSNCLFGDRCRFILVRPNGNVDNSGNKKCLHKHPCENDNDFIIRTGLDSYKSAEPRPIVEVETINKNVIWDKYSYPSVKPIKPVNSDKLEIVVKQAVQDKTETVLRVPSNLAVQAIELAIKSGVTNIRLEIIQNA